MKTNHPTNAYDTNSLLRERLKNLLLRKEFRGKKNEDLIQKLNKEALENKNLIKLAFKLKNEINIDNLFCGKLNIPKIKLLKMDTSQTKIPSSESTIVYFPSLGYFIGMLCIEEWEHILDNDIVDEFWLAPEIKAPTPINSPDTIKSLPNKSETKNGNTFGTSSEN